MNQESGCAPEMVASRRKFSLDRLEALREGVRESTSRIEFGTLFAFAAGSYARGEAGTHSDVDLFFGYNDLRDHEIVQRRTNELRLFGRVIEEVERLGFPQLSADCRYLKTHRISDVQKELGGDRDDVENHFTFRMLLLLESRCILGDDHYQQALRRVVEFYHRDYPRHEYEFQPWFLLNDIIRYWKTLTLNYENKRREEVDDTDSNERRARNFKLKYSRMTTCFATVAALGTMMENVQPDDIHHLTQLTPSERFDEALERMPAIAAPLAVLRQEYCWFLELTGHTKNDLYQLFGDSTKRSDMFARADRYGSLMYDLLRAVDRELEHKNISFLRLLVI